MASLDTKLSEVVYHGSPFEALFANYVSPRDLLIYLCKVPVSPETSLTYKAVSHFWNISVQYLPKEFNKRGAHFIVLKPEYAPMFTYLGGSLELPSYQKPKKGRKQIASLKKTLKVEFHPSGPPHNLEVLCGTTPPQTQEEVLTFMKGRN